MRNAWSDSLHLDIRELIAEAAGIYAATGNRQAILAADCLRALVASHPSAPLPDPKPLPGLDSAFATVSPSALRSLLERVAAHLPWTTSDVHVPESFAGRSASAEIAGPDGLVPTQGLRFGLFWQSPETFYPPHSHAAEELYFVLSGRPLWQKDDAPFARVAPGSLVHHTPYQRHAMRTERDGLLAMWIWTGDLSFSSYRFHETA